MGEIPRKKRRFIPEAMKNGTLICKKGSKKRLPQHERLPVGVQNDMLVQSMLFSCSPIELTKTSKVNLTCMAVHIAKFEKLQWVVWSSNFFKREHKKIVHYLDDLF